MTSQSKSNNGKDCHSCEITSLPTLEVENPNLLTDCLLAAVKVLMNLTNDNPVGCKQIAACSGLETLYALISGCYPSFNTFLSPCIHTDESILLPEGNNKLQYENDKHFNDQELDFLVIILGLLVNLVEKDSRNRLSKEFLDTRSLVTHTFMSRKVGKRTHHLALNKAIYVLMGWKSVITPNGACVYEVLPEAEAFTLKDDLILWPPLVIIHNSSIINNNADARQVITIEHMEVILRGLGFSEGKIKVHYGKPTNQSIMVVKFLPTFSRLQEAEKLHK